MSKSNRQMSMLTLCAVTAAATFPGNIAQAQTADQLIVTGRIGGQPWISQLVDFADLDLTTQAGEAALKARVRDTARDLCARLGESDADTPPVLRPCEGEAYLEALPHMRELIAAAAPRTVLALAPAPSAPPAVNPPAVDAAALVPSPAPAVRRVSNGPVADTPENRAIYGPPMSDAGRQTAAAGD